MEDQPVSAAPDPAPDSERVMTRRQLLVAATAGGAALAVSALGGAAVGSLTTRAEYEVELKKLQTLVAMYEQLEKIGIDAIVGTGMKIVNGVLDTLKNGVQMIRDGIGAVQKAIQAFQTALDNLQTVLDNFRGMFDNLRKAAEGVGQTLTDLQDKFNAAQGLVVGALGTALPLADSIRGFFNALVDKIPFGVGDTIRRAIDGLVALIRAIPDAVGAVTSQLLQPLAQLTFPRTTVPSVKTSLLDALTSSLLDPLQKFLTDVETTLTTWQKDFVQPVQTALDDRARLRAQIDAYRKENKI